MPKPFLVLARITVGWPTWRAACQYAEKIFTGSWPPRRSRSMSSSERCATSSRSSGYLLKKCSRL
jgi:hypothetical protein